MSAETRCLEGGFPDTNPGVSAGKTAFRAACGRYTVDIVPIDSDILAVVGDGVGRPPVSAVLTPGTAAASSSDPVQTDASVVPDANRSASTSGM